MNATMPDFVAGPLPPPFPETRRTIDFSPLEFILGLVAVITIPALIYTFFCAIKCPPNPFRGGRRRSSDSLPVIPEVESITKDVASDVKYRKDDPVISVDSECPVCLSAFSDGEEVRQLSGCKHSFHASCINKWLNSSSNCPVCRAVVPAVKRPRPPSSSSMARDPDLQQGLPDAASLV